jgi:glyoxylase-like metal-dependent hydrolase (beta-lactamase superfamily II)
VFYPPDYQFDACEVDMLLYGDQQLILDDLLVNVISTPGHCKGHVSFVIETEGKRALFSGDAFFPEGKILLQDIWDCALQESLRSIERLSIFHVDHLLAGHGVPVINDAQDHFKIAMDRMSNLVVPINLI